MSGDGRDRPLGGGTDGRTGGGAGPGGLSSPQVPSQGGPGGSGRPGGDGGSGVSDGSGAPGGPGTSRGAGTPGGAGGSGGSRAPRRSAAGAAGRSADADGSVPTQRVSGTASGTGFGTNSGKSGGDGNSGGPFGEPSADEAPLSAPSTPDVDLIQRMRGGDNSAYEELFRRHSDAVRRYARTCCRDAHTADDLTAEVFARTLQAVRGGAGPEHAVRAYLLTTVRRVAATWTKSAKREQLVEDFAVFAAQAVHTSEVSEAQTLDLGADVLAMHEAEQSMAMQAFRSLPERWQAVLWHTTVEEESPSEVAPLFGLSANATAVLARRAREGLKQAYLQAHVNAALTSGGDCARYADRLGAYARGGLRMRAERGLRKHLEECAECRRAAGELAQVNNGIPALVPVAVIGWFAAGFSLKAAGIVAGGAAGAAGAGAAAAATGATGATGGATGGASGGGSVGAAAASEGAAAPVKAGIAALVAIAATAGLVYALVRDSQPEPKPEAKPPAAQPVVPRAPAPSPEPPAPPAPKPSPPEKSAPAATPPAKPERTPARTPKPTPSSAPAKPEPPAPPAPKPTPSPTPSPTPPPEPSPSPEPPTVPAVYQVNELPYDVPGDGPDSGPEVRLGGSNWLWQRSSMSIGGTHYGHGVSTHASSSVTIDLNRDCSSYAAMAGVDDMTLGLGAVRFSVYGDGGRLWRSPVVHGGDAAVPVQVGIAGQRTIRLVVEPHTPFGRVALADWARSRISCG
ncbi:sigma-70 family RNA polymerase sigma factor [Streptomyces sp. NPDC088116]|uniref:sigma-70 family RNA polymerase sigma factor n=1 Tax=Streptomyces sp. NPDC088116 TaxID=3365825 RepID=UPI003810EABF